MILEEAGRDFARDVSKFASPDDAGVASGAGVSLEAAPNAIFASSAAVQDTGSTSASRDGKADRS